MNRFDMWRTHSCVPRRHFCRRLLLFATILLTTNCGYIGAPLVPLANVPQKISDLAAVQRGPVLIVHFSVPIRTTENVLLKIPPDLDLHIGPAGEHFSLEDWARESKAIPDRELKDGLATYRIPTREWTGKEVAIAVRSIGPNGKLSEWSNYQIMPVVAPPEAPSIPATTNTPAGVRITWTGRGDQFRVLRAGSDGIFSVASTVKGNEWIDNTIEYGKPYSYEVQALVDLGNQKLAESELSKSSEPQTFADTFPPAVPTGLRADPTPGSVSLVWEADSEPDLAGYRVYRSEGDGAWRKLADVSTVPSYNDSTMERGKTYHYAVTAIDRANNESDRSVAVTIVP